MQKKRNKARKIKLGRPPEEDRLDIVRNNGFTERQWSWLEKEAEKKGVTAMFYARSIVQWFIDEVEASRTGSVAAVETVEQVETKFQSSQKSSKSTKSTKE